MSLTLLACEMIGLGMGKWQDGQLGEIQEIFS